MRARELRRNRRKVNLQQQPFEILLMLLERPGDVVMREELRERLWPGDTFVDFDHGINSAIRRLRDALSDSAESPKFVQTVGRRGYRFIFPAAELSYDTANPRGAKPVAVPVLVPEPRVAAEPPAPFAVQRRPRRLAVLLAACAILAISTVYWWTAPSRARSRRLAELQRLAIVPLTTLPGRVASPTFSPDGSQVAFAWEEELGKGYDLYVKVVGSDTQMRLTHHLSRELYAAWSPEGRTIALARVEDADNSGVYLIGPTGGPERKLAVQGPVGWPGGGISWSPDGKLLAYVDRASHPASQDDLELFADARLQIVLLSMDTLQKAPVETGCIAPSHPLFSPSGRFLSWVCNKGGHHASLWLLRRSDGTKTQLLERDEGINGVAWSRDERRIVFSAMEGYGALWEVEVSEPKHIARLPVGHDAGDLAANPAGPGLVYMQGVFNYNIWRLDLQSTPPPARRVVYSSRGQRSASISADGTRIAFESDRGGSREVWVCDADGSNAQQLTSFGMSTTGTPRWSPDGKLIAFDSRGAGDSDIYVVDPDGGVPRKLNIDVQDNALASWSHDGQWIYFVNGEDHGKPSVWKVPSGGGHAAQIADHAYFPLQSPDSEYVYFVRTRKLWRTKPDGSKEEPVAGMPEVNSMGDEWFPTASSIYFLTHQNDRAVINRFDMNTKHVTPIYTTQKPTPVWIGGLPVSSDGKYLLYTQVDERSSNLMMIENWQ